MMFMVRSTRCSRRFFRSTLQTKIRPVKGSGYFYVFLSNQQAGLLRQRQFKFEAVPNTAFVC